MSSTRKRTLDVPDSASKRPAGRETLTKTASTKRDRDEDSLQSPVKTSRRSVAVAADAASLTRKSTEVTAKTLSRNSSFTSEIQTPIRTSSRSRSYAAVAASASAAVPATRRVPTIVEDEPVIEPSAPAASVAPSSSTAAAIAVPAPIEAEDKELSMPSLRSPLPAKVQSHLDGLWTQCADAIIYCTAMVLGPFSFAAVFFLYLAHQLTADKFFAVVAVNFVLLTGAVLLFFFGAALPFALLSRLLLPSEQGSSSTNNHGNRVSNGDSGKRLATALVERVVLLVALAAGLLLMQQYLL